MAVLAVVSSVLGKRGQISFFLIPREVNRQGNLLKEPGMSSFVRGDRMVIWTLNMNIKMEAIHYQWILPLLAYMHVKACYV